MTLKVVLAAVLVLLGCVPLATADPVLLVNGNGLLTAPATSGSLEPCTT